MSSQNGLEVRQSPSARKAGDTSRAQPQAPTSGSAPLFDAVVWDTSPDAPPVPVAAEEIRDFVRTAINEAGRKSVMGHLEPRDGSAILTLFTRSGQVLDRRTFDLADLPCTPDGLRRMVAAIVPVVTRLPSRGSKASGATRVVRSKPSGPPSLTLIRGGKA